MKLFIWPVAIVLVVVGIIVALNFGQSMLSESSNQGPLIGLVVLALVAGFILCVVRWLARRAATTAKKAENFLGDHDLI